MPKKFYLDTAIWRDYFEDRADGIRPLGEFAFQFLKKCQARKWVVLVSPEVKRELLVIYSNETVKEIFSSFKDIIVKVDYSKEQESEAYSFWIRAEKRFPFPDILHSIIARDAGAILVSRDRHFAEIGIVASLLPEDCL